MHMENSAAYDHKPWCHWRVSGASWWRVTWLTGLGSMSPSSGPLAVSSFSVALAEMKRPELLSVPYCFHSQQHLLDWFSWWQKRKHVQKCTSAFSSLNASFQMRLLFFPYIVIQVPFEVSVGVISAKNLVGQASHKGSPGSRVRKQTAPP